MVVMQDSCEILPFARGWNDDLLLQTVAIVLVLLLLLHGLWAGWSRGWRIRNVDAHWPIRPLTRIVVFGSLLPVFSAGLWVSLRPTEISTCGVRIQTLRGWEEIRYQDVRVVDRRGVFGWGPAILLDTGPRWLTVHLSAYERPDEVRKRLLRYTSHAVRLP